MIFGWFFSGLDKHYKIASLIFILVISAFGIRTILTTNTGFGLAVKRDLIKEVASYIGDKPYELAGEGNCHKYEGWRFLFTRYFRSPEKSYTDENLGWIYKDEIGSNPPYYSIEIIETRIEERPRPSEYKISNGGFTAYIDRSK